MSRRAFTVSAPGRICLFGEHQDYLGLPVIAAAINRRIRAEVQFSCDGHRLHIDMPDINDRMTLDPSQEQQYTRARDYLRAGVNVLLREGARFPYGASIRITSDIPMQAGVSSSSAMVVMWLRALCEMAETPMNPTLKRWRDGDTAQRCWSSKSRVE